jgi:type I restriction enzyme R subunit
LRADFVGTMTTLRDKAFQDVLVNYPRAKRVFYVAPGVEDRVESQWLIRDGAGKEYKPDDYLEAFERFVRENRSQIEAIRILLDRPRDWSSTALAELRQKLLQSNYRFTVENLRRAHEAHYHKALADIISMIKRAADHRQPLLTASERVDRAFEKLGAGRTFTMEQQRWLDRIRVHMVENLSLDREDFDVMPVFSREGGWNAAHRSFGVELEPLIRTLNEAIAA